MNNLPKIVKPYGAWRSPITSDLVVAESIGLSEPMLDGKEIYWLEGRPLEGGRYVLVRRAADGTISDCIPQEFNARTRVHEYGGGAVAVYGGTVYFAEFSTQRLFRVAPGGAPEPITPPPPADQPDAGYRYADGFIDRRRNRWVGVREDHTRANQQAVNTLVDIDLAKAGAGRVLIEGNDFYASPRLSPDGSRLAWVTWNHPDMPWVSTELWLADVSDDGALRNSRKIAGGPQESLVQPEWSPDGILHFISDRTGWWDLYRMSGSGDVEPLAPRDAEFAQPQWNLGMSSYAFTGADQIVCTFVEGGRSLLATLDLKSLKLTPVPLSYSDYAYVRAAGDTVVFRAGSATDPVAIVQLNLKTSATTILRAAAPAPTPELRAHFSVPQPVEFATTFEGEQTTAHGLFYVPTNSEYAAPDADRPPLLVKCHGGPTAAASATLNMNIQYWTSRGIAVLDVDYGGSSGYGRKYRQRLHLNWGVVDVDDAINGAKHLISKSLVDQTRCVISGGSAGGYTTLAALVFRDFFRGGASYYGVSDPSALARDTHKFESHYLDWLIGPYPAQESLYRERSPVLHADKVSAPIVFFQGEEDKIVPPSQTNVMVDALRQRHIPVGYYLFAAEQHGFRKAPNIKTSLDSELFFYSVHVFGTELCA